MYIGFLNSSSTTKNGNDERKRDARTHGKTIRGRTKTHRYVRNSLSHYNMLLVCMNETIA
jgi:hypothetical protein